MAGVPNELARWGGVWRLYRQMWVGLATTLHLQ